MGSRAKESYKDAKLVANLVKNHPTESAGIAAIFVVVKGRGIFRVTKKNKPNQPSTGRGQSHTVNDTALENAETISSPSSARHHGQNHRANQTTHFESSQPHNKQADKFDPNSLTDGLPEADLSKLPEGRRGGKVLDQEWRNEYQSKLRELDPKLSVESSLKIDEYLEMNKQLAGFQPQTATVILRTDATLFEAVHELGHVEHFVAARYLSVSEPAREVEAWRYVFEYNEKHPGRFTIEELEHAKKQYNIEFQKLFHGP